MGIFSSILKGALSPLNNGVAAGKAAPIIARITGRSCTAEQIESLKWWAERNGQRKYVWNEFEYAFHQMYQNYFNGSSGLYPLTPNLKIKILGEYEECKRNGLITDAYVISLYEKSN